MPSLRTSALTLAAILLLLAAPFAAAAPLTLHRAGLDPGVAVVHEDDEEQINWPGNGLSGIRNRASDASGTNNAANGLPNGFGDGSVILDAKWVMDSVGHTTTFSPGYYAAAFDADKHILPGHGAFFAWYGRWDDRDNDGAIRDLPGDPQNEFEWFGTVNGKTTSMPLYLVPATTTVGSSVSYARIQPGAVQPTWALGSTQKHDSQAPSILLQDQTQSGEGWITPSAGAGLPALLLDEGFLMTTYSLVAVGVDPAPETERRYNLDTPGALLDVDRYSSLSGDVETLYLAVARPAAVLVDETLRTVRGLNPTQPPGADDTNEIYNTALSAVGPLTGRTIQSPFPREPNHADDSFPGATWGGGRDYAQTANSYDGHANDWDFYADVHVVIRQLGAGHLDLGPAGIRSGSPGSAGLIIQDLSPTLSEHESEQRGASTLLLGTRARIVLWKDFNEDGWIGEVCDGSSVSARDCDDPYRNGYSTDPHNWVPNDEIFGVCSLTSANGGSTTFTPIGGSWPGVFILRDFDAPTSRVWGQGAATLIEGPFFGTEELELRFLENACDPHNILTKSRDAILIPGGSLTVGVRTQTEIVLLADVYNAEIDFTVPAGRTVVDVDVIVPTL